MNWMQIERMSKIRQENLSGGDMLQGGIFQGIINSSSGENQQAQLNYGGGASTIALPMPFESTNSWIRSIPMAGSAALVAYRRDTGEATFLRYLNDKPTTKLAGYSQGMNLYRPLLPGEHEIASSGFAQSHYGQRPVLEQRAGIIRSWLNQDKAECGQKAPLHTRQLYRNLSNEVGDEERFGVVRRPAQLTNPISIAINGTTSSNFYDYPYPDFSLPGGVPAAFSEFSQVVAAASVTASALTGTFKIRPYGKEYLRVIKSSIWPLPPYILVDIREGNVFDDKGKQVKGEGGAFLRASHKYYTTIMDSTEFTVDDLGNVVWSLSLAAINGMTTHIPFGSYKLDATKGIEISTLTNLDLSSTLNTSISAVADLSLNSYLNTDFSTGLNFSHSANGTYDATSFLAMSLESQMNLTAKAGLVFQAEGGIQMNLKAPLVAIGSSPSEPTVMGTQLSTWLQTLCQLFINNAMNVGMGNLSAPVPLSPAIMTGINSLLAQIPLLTSKTITVSA